MHAQRILSAARLYGRAATSLIMHARGIEHSTHGVDNCLACINLALARGQVGKAGGGTMMVTGQGNGQGGREVGQKANQLPGYRHIDVPEEREHIAKFWGIPVEELPWEGAAATEMVHLMADGEIKSCLIVCSNLMVSLPDNHVVQRALTNLDPLIVIDFFLSETAELADVVLPGTVWCEDEGTTTNLEGRVIKINRAAEPPGEAMADWRIVDELAKRLGRGQFFPYESVLDIWNELRNASKGGVSDYYGITWEKIDEQGGVFWPCPSLDHPGTPRLFTDMVDFVNRGVSVATQPTVCMHCEDPLAPCAQVCPAMAILITAEGVVQQADPSRCIGCRNCVYACPFGVPKFDIRARLMKKCNLCYDRTSQDLKPWCAQACPTQALWYGDYEEFVNQREGHPVNFTAFGTQTVRTRVYHVLPQETPRLDLMALLDKAQARTRKADQVDATREEAWVL